MYNVQLYVASVIIILGLLTLVVSSILLFYINQANITIISSVIFHMWSYNSFYRVIFSYIVCE